MHAVNQLSPEDALNVEEIAEKNGFICGMALDFPQNSQHNVIFTDQRLTCNNSVESRFYKNDFGFIPCHKCGIDLDDDGIAKFNSLKKEFANVIPCCNGVCAAGPTKGWKTTGQSKRKLRNGKRKALAMNIDLHQFRSRFTRLAG